MVMTHRTHVLECQTRKYSFATLQKTELQSRKMCGKPLSLQCHFASAANPLPQVFSTRNVRHGFHCLKEEFLIQGMTIDKTIYLSKDITVSLWKNMLYIDTWLVITDYSAIQKYDALDLDLNLKVLDPRMLINVFIDRLKAQPTAKLTLIAIFNNDDMNYKG